ncbi:MAG: hypothetical protein ABMA02_02470 [Saprospiraceae bacterium]
MFHRQSREPYPLRKIIGLFIVALLLVLFVLYQSKNTEQAPVPPLLIQPE